MTSLGNRRSSLLPPEVRVRLRSRFDTIRQSISEVPIIEVPQRPVVQQEEERGPDGGFGWFVLVSSFLCLCILDGIAYTFGVFLDPLIAQLEVKRSQVSIVGSLNVAMYAFTGPVAAKLVSRFGTRKVCMTGCLMAAIGLGLSGIINNVYILMITYSVLSGAGFGMMYLPSVIAVANHFTRLRSMAIGICLCGAGVGTFVLAPFEAYLIETYSLSIAFFVLAGLCVVCSLFAITMRPVKYVPLHEELDDQSPLIRPTLNTSEDGLFKKVVCFFIDRGLYDSSEFSMFMLVILADSFATFGLFIPYQHLTPIARNAGISHTHAAFLISVIGMSSSVGRLIAGWVSDRPWLHPSSICAIGMLFSAPACFVVTATESYPVFVAMAASFGFSTGCWIAVMSPLFVRLLGLPLLTPAFGLLTGIRGISALTGPPLAAKLVENFEDRSIAMYCSGICMMISSILFLLVSIINRRRMKRRQYQVL